MTAATPPATLFAPNSFARRVMLLVGGTAAAQLIAFAVAPVLTRLYGPETFGLLAIQTSIIGMALTIGTGKFEAAIPMAARRDTAVNLGALAVAGSIVTGAIAAVVLLFVRRGGILLWTVPIGMIVAGTYDTLTYAAIRKNEYRPMFVSKIVQAAGQSATPAALAWAGTWPLLAGDVAGRALATIVFAATLLRNRLHALTAATVSGMKEAAREFRRFPLIYAWGTALNTANAQIVPILIAALFGTATAGFFSLGYRVLFLPMSLVGQSVSQVFYGEAARLRLENPTALPAFVSSIALRLGLISLIPAAILAVAGPRLFAFVFGARWAEAGEIARILVIVFIVQFVYSPISALFNILGRQGAHLLWSAGLLAASVSALYIGSRVASARGALVIFAVCNAVAYGVALLTFMRWMCKETRA